jgi:hypothetical protein
MFMLPMNWFVCMCAARAIVLVFMYLLFSSSTAAVMVVIFAGKEKNWSSFRLCDSIVLVFTTSCLMWIGLCACAARAGVIVLVFMRLF